MPTSDAPVLWVKNGPGFYRGSHYFYQDGDVVTATLLLPNFVASLRLIPFLRRVEISWARIALAA